MTSYMGYPLNEKITAGHAYTVRIPRSLSASRFAAARELISDVDDGAEGATWSATLERDERTAEIWAVTLGAGASPRNLQFAESKYGVTVEQIDDPPPNPDHIPSDDPPGADSSPMSELQRNALAYPAPVTEHQAKRQGIIKGLRELADALEATPELPTPYDMRAQIFWRIGEDGRLAGRVSQDDARAAMAALPGAWRKDVSGSYIDYERQFGDDVIYGLHLDRADVCRRIQVGTRTVPAHDEPVYEWDCEPETDVSTALAEHTQPAIPDHAPYGWGDERDQQGETELYENGGERFFDEEPDTDVSVALAEHTAPALDVIERAAIAGVDEIPADVPDDPFRGIPNADDRDNERL